MTTGSRRPAAKSRQAPDARANGRGQRTRERLLDAAVQVFARHGYHAARVDDIVKRAATSHGTFYLYFASKEDLFWTLTADVAAKMSGLVHSFDRLDAGRSGQAALRDWIERFADLYDHYGPVIRAWTEAETDTSAFGQLGHRIFGDVASAFADRIAASPATGLDPRVASLALLAMVERLNYYVMSGQLAAERRQTIDLLTTVTHRSLFGDSAETARNANSRSPRTSHAAR